MKLMRKLFVKILFVMVLAMCFVGPIWHWSQEAGLVIGMALTGIGMGIDRATADEVLR